MLQACWLMFSLSDYRPWKFFRWALSLIWSRQSWNGAGNPAKPCTIVFPHRCINLTRSVHFIDVLLLALRPPSSGTLVGPLHRIHRLPLALAKKKKKKRAKPDCSFGARRLTFCDSFMFLFGQKPAPPRFIVSTAKNAAAQTLYATLTTNV